MGKQYEDDTMSFIEALRAGHSEADLRQVFEATLATATAKYNEEKAAAAKKDAEVRAKKIAEVRTKRHELIKAVLNYIKAVDPDTFDAISDEEIVAFEDELEAFENELNEATGFVKMIDSLMNAFSEVEYKDTPSTKNKSKVDPTDIAGADEIIKRFLESL